MSCRYLPPETGSVAVPSQVRVQEVLLVVSRNASVKYLTPDAWAVAVMASVVQVSKYGAKTCAGSGVAAIAPELKMPVRSVAVAAIAATRSRRSPIRSPHVARRLQQGAKTVPVTVARVGIPATLQSRAGASTPGNADLSRRRSA